MKIEIIDEGGQFIGRYSSADEAPNDFIRQLILDATRYGEATGTDHDGITASAVQVPQMQNMEELDELIHLIYVPGMDVVFSPYTTAPILFHRLMKRSDTVINPPYRDGGYEIASEGVVRRMERRLP